MDKIVRNGTAPGTIDGLNAAAIPATERRIAMAGKLICRNGCFGGLSAVIPGRALSARAWNPFPPAFIGPDEFSGAQLRTIARTFHSRSGMTVWSLEHSLALEIAEKVISPKPEFLQSDQARVDCPVAREKIFHFGRRANHR